MKNQIENLIMERINDREHADIYNSMISKREDEIHNLQLKIMECREYDEVCKRKRESLRSTEQVLEEIISSGEISNANLRMLVNQVKIHQNEDKSVDIEFEMNGDFESKVSIATEATEIAV